MRRRLGIGLVALVAVAGLLGGCSGADDESGGAEDRDRAASGALDEGGARAADGGGGGGEEAGDQGAVATGAAGPAQQGQPVEDRRRIVYTSDLRVRVDEPTTAARRAVEIAEDAGGELGSQSEDAGDEVRVTVRVPSDGFRDVLDELAGLGRVLARSVDTEDVTEQVVDLDSRLANARSSVERLRTLFAEAQDVNHVVAIEGALTAREAEVESLTGQLRLLEDRADRSTITAVFVSEAEPEVDDDIPGFGEGLRRGWVGFRNVLSLGVTAVGFALPFLAVLVPLALLARWLRRRRAPAAPPVPPAPTPDAP